MLDGKVVFPVIGQTLVERGVLFGGDLGGVASPDGLGLVKLLVLGLGLLDLFGLLGLSFLVLDFLDLLVFTLSDFLVILDLLQFVQFAVNIQILAKCGRSTNLFNLLCNNELNGVGDEFGVLLDDLLDLLLLEILELVLLQVEAKFGTATKGLAISVGGDGEGSAGSGFPDVLLVVIVLGDDLNTLGNEVGRVET